MRLATLEAAGEEAVPFTTGLLIGGCQQPPSWLGRQRCSILLRAAAWQVLCRR